MQQDSLIPFNRQEWLSLLAKSQEKDLTELWEIIGLTPNFTWQRRPEIGSVMVQGRMGGTGDAFNVGEVTVTRGSIRLESGEVGHAYTQGRSKKKAEIIAIADALMQTDKAGMLKQKLLIPLLQKQSNRHQTVVTEAEKTRVDFFTLVRGED